MYLEDSGIGGSVSALSRHRRRHVHCARMGVRVLRMTALEIGPTIGHEAVHLGLLSADAEHWQRRACARYRDGHRRLIGMRRRCRPDRRHAQRLGRCDLLVSAGRRGAALSAGQPCAARTSLATAQQIVRAPICVTRNSTK